MVQHIDLYRSLRGNSARGAPSPVPAAVAIGAAVAALLAHVWLEARALDSDLATAARLQQDAQRVEKMIAELGAQSSAGADSIAAQVADVAALEALAARLSGGALGRTEPFTEPLRAFARARAEGVWLTGIRLDNSSGQLVLDGKALDAARVPQLIAALQREPRFAGTAFARIEMQPAKEIGAVPTGTVQFRIASATTATVADSAGATRP